MIGWLSGILAGLVSSPLPAGIGFNHNQGLEFALYNDVTRGLDVPQLGWQNNKWNTNQEIKMALVLAG